MLAAVERFLEQRDFEESAPSAAKGDKALEQIRDRAFELNELLSGDLAPFVDLALHDHFRPPHLPALTKFSELRAILRSLVEACDQAPSAKDFTQAGIGFRPLEAWNDMVFTIFESLADAELPTAVWVDHNNQPSPAIRFIVALDGMVPRARPPCSMEAWRDRIETALADTGKS
ncbi:hypothetical protein [Bradyrhizobium japonicum]|uniref:hypothetical protein n=1 Tax=Bradyrhizobium japonicum TaxID=375 RepID=UPI00351397F6